MFEGPRSLGDINKLFFSPGRCIFLRFSPFSGEDVIIVCLRGESRAWGISLGVARAITLAVFLIMARGGNAIYGFVRRCNNPSKPPSGGPNPELREPGNHLVNRTAIMIS